MELFQLKHFFETAKYKNMTKAAKELSLAQPALSKSIQKLELELGTPLFLRSSKGMTLTEQGKILLKYCIQIFDALENANREISESIHEKATIRICLRSASELIGPTLSTFIKMHPHISIEITEDAASRYDFLIDSATQSNLPPNSNVLLSEELCLAVSDKHPFSQLKIIPFSILADEKLIVLSSSSSFQEIMTQLLKTANITPNISCSCNNDALLQELISMNMGISIAASINWKHSHSPENIKLIPFEGHPSRLIYYKKSSSLHSHAFEDFEENLIQHFKALQN